MCDTAVGPGEPKALSMRRSYASVSCGVLFLTRGGTTPLMDTWLIVVIVIVAVVVLALLAWAATRGRERRIESKRAEAGELRQEAQSRAQRADERQALAEEQAEQARRERLEAESRLERADDVDPDTDR
jgi:flagellar biosynthesis/type III secretory pathway M-ring protein FliF/YscJ